MRNSATEHNQPLRYPSHRAWLWVLLMLPVPLTGSADEELKISTEDMVAIHADQAWEDIEPDIVHFEGNFEMQVRDLQVNADRVTLYGKLDNPDRLELQGSPASFQLTHALVEGIEPVQGEAQEMVYERESELITLSGSARLVQGANILHSNEVEYDINSNRFHAKGENGVHLEVDTKN